MPPKISIYNDYESMSRAAADRVIKLLNKKPTAVICLPSGNTPKGMFDELVLVHQSGKTDFSQCTFIGLDEWVGLGAGDDGSCRYSLDKDFLVPIGFRADQITFFDGYAAPHLECTRVNESIVAAGGLDLIVLGLGMNGHLALNEPGTPFDWYAHVSDQEPLTVQVGQKYFKKETLLTKGITLGIRHMMEAKCAILIASGSAKAPIVQKAVALPANTNIPATALQMHSNSEFILDSDAALLLN